MHPEDHGVEIAFADIINRLRAAGADLSTGRDALEATFVRNDGTMLDTVDVTGVPLASICDFGHAMRRAYEQGRVDAESERVEEWADGVHVSLTSGTEALRSNGITIETWAPWGIRAIISASSKPVPHYFALATLPAQGTTAGALIEVADIRKARRTGLDLGRRDAL